MEYGILSFFFQAEVGMRVLTVTGVQTCALPILKGLMPSYIENSSIARLSISGSGPHRRPSRGSKALQLQDVAARQRGGRTGCISVPQRRKRSEERRVGKECRSRWSPYH